MALRGIIYRHLRVPPKYRGVEQLVARRAHNPEVVGSSPASATIISPEIKRFQDFFLRFGGRKVGKRIFGLRENLFAPYFDPYHDRSQWTGQQNPIYRYATLPE